MAGSVVAHWKIQLNSIGLYRFSPQVYMTFAIDSIKLITLLMRREWKRGRGARENEEEKKIVPTGRDALTWETSCENIFFLLISFVNESVVSRNSWRLHTLLSVIVFSRCCLLFKWNLFAYSSKQFQDENVHLCVVCVWWVYEAKKTQPPENVQWLQIVLMSRGFEWMIGTVDKHAILFKSHYHCCSRRWFGWRQTVFFSSLFLSLPFSRIYFDRFSFWKYPNIQIHLAPSHSSLSRCVCTIITVSFRLMSIILSLSLPPNVSTNRTLESRNKSNHLLIENRAYSAPLRQATKKVKEKLESHVNHVRFNRTKIQIKIFSK